MAQPLPAAEPPLVPVKRILICDQRSSVRVMLTRLVSDMPNIESIEAVKDGSELLSSFTKSRADLVMIGYQDGDSGLREATQSLRTSDPSAAVIVFGSAEDAQSLAAAISLGAKGLFLWDFDHRDTVRETPKYGPVSTPPSCPPPRNGGALLTDQELHILRGMAQGQSNAEMGGHLQLSEEAVKAHVRRLFKRLGARDRAHAVALGWRRGLVN